MDSLKIDKAKVLIGALIVFILFQSFKFISSYLINLNLPKGKIVFSSDADGDEEIYTMNVNSLNLKQLTRNSSSKTNTALDNSPSFSQSGAQIVFISRRQKEENVKYIYDFQGRAIGESYSGGAFDVYIMNSDGSSQIPLTYGNLCRDPFFSPDGRKVIFVSKRPSSVVMMDLHSREHKVLNLGYYWFAPDGKKIFDNFQCDLSAMNIDGTGRVRLTNLLKSEEFYKDSRDRRLIIYELAFSRDEKKLAFILKEDRGDYPGEFYDITRFYTINIDGSDLEEVHRIDCSHPSIQYIPDTLEKPMFCNIKRLRYSFDNQKLIYIADLNYKKGIFSLDLTNGHIKELTYRKQNWRDIFDFTFTPDGQKIIFVAEISSSRPYTKYHYYYHYIKSWLKYFLLRQASPHFGEAQYLCIMNLDGTNYRRIIKLPVNTKVGRDFIHWE